MINIKHQVNISYRHAWFVSSLFGFNEKQSILLKIPLAFELIRSYDKLQQNNQYLFKTTWSMSRTELIVNRYQKSNRYCSSCDLHFSRIFACHN